MVCLSTPILSGRWRAFSSKKLKWTNDLESIVKHMKLYEVRYAYALLYVTGTSSRPILRHDEIVRQPVGSMAQNLT